MSIVTNGDECLINFLKKYASVIENANGIWYYVPFWFKGRSDGSLQMINFENLPKEVIDGINEYRNEKLDDNTKEA